MKEKAKFKVSKERDYIIYTSIAKFNTDIILENSDREMKELLKFKNMIDAHTARIQSKDFLENDIEFKKEMNIIYEQIEQATKKGEFNIEVLNLDYPKGRLLKEKGYEIRFKKPAEKEQTEIFSTIWW